MDNKTVQYKRTLRGSVGAGVGALFNGNGRRYFILEHKDTSKYHKAGESQKIIIDQVELGRDGNCQVRFDEDLSTVSRRHAAIVKDGDRWKIVPLSKTNSTYVNGRSINSEWYLENGDEIQLSTNGPRMGFIVPAGKQSLVSSIKMTERLDLFRKQALRPYKTAIAVMGVLIVLITSFGGYKIYDQHLINEKIKADQVAIKAENDSLKTKIATASEELIKNKELMSKMSNQLVSLRKLVSSVDINSTPQSSLDDKLGNGVYYIELVGYQLTDPNGSIGIAEVGDSLFDEKVTGMSGSGFLLNDGTFVTARHVAEPFFYASDNLSVKLNLCSSNGFKVDAILVAISPDGQKYVLKSSDFKYDKSEDKFKSYDDYKLRVVGVGPTDHASASVGDKGLLAYDSQLSNSLKAGEKLTIYGYPLGLGASKEKISVSYSSAEVARDGIADAGYILTTSTGFEQGNSGGPVFADRNGEKVVIGIVSAGAGRSTGFVVPISRVK